MDPDREAIEKAVRAWCSGTGKDLVSTVVDSVIAHLARLEGEKPKRATIQEMLDALANHNGCIASLKHEAQALREAAAVLRAVGEFKRDVEISNPQAATKLYRSLPLRRVQEGRRSLGPKRSPQEG